MALSNTAFDNFTEDARGVAARSQQILQRYGRKEMDTVHLLLAMLEQPQGVVPAILRELGVSLEWMKAQLERELEKGHNSPEGKSDTVFVTPGVFYTISRAKDEADRRGDQLVSTEHIFVGICAEQRTPAARILFEAGITKDRVIAAIDKIRGKG